MADREKVIKGLEYHITNGDCRECPYWNDKLCRTQILKDALELLKKYEPRVMTLKEVLENTQEIGFPCWVEDHVEDTSTTVLVPAVVTSDDTYVQYTGNDYYEGAIYHWAYNKRLRCWTSQPTDAQRERVKWNA